MQAMCVAAVASTPFIFVLCHRGPIAGPPDVQFVLDYTSGVVGLFDASSIERLVTELILEIRRRIL